MNRNRANFSIGQLIHHRLFDYRGVIVDVDPVYLGTDEWYEQVARSRPPRDKPWYHVLVDNASHSTYVAERNLEPDDSDRPINHPAIDQHFERFSNGSYVSRTRSN